MLHERASGWQSWVTELAHSPEEAVSHPALAIQVNALQAMCRQVFGFRLAMIAIATPFAIAHTAPGLATGLIGGAILVTFMGSYALFRDWERFGPQLLRHRWVLAVDVFLGALLLITATPESTLAYVTVCTPLLAGLVYSWRGAAVFAALQTVIVLGVYNTVPGLSGSDATVLLLPGFCVIAGAVGVTLRNLLLRFGAASQALTETRARLAVSEAVEKERTRLAREMHDSVAKTLHGLALAADGLAGFSWSSGPIHRSAPGRACCQVCTSGGCGVARTPHGSAQGVRAGRWRGPHLRTAFPGVRFRGQAQCLRYLPDLRGP